MYVHVLECEYAHERSDACIPLRAVSVLRVRPLLRDLNWIRE